MTLSRILTLAARGFGVVALVLGLFWWAGFYAVPLVAHMAAGWLFVLALFGLAAMALTRSTAIAVVAFLAGALVPALGLAQQRMGLGEAQWLLWGGHVVVAILAIGLAEMVAKRARPSGANA
ncbi:hypothetical protein [Afifella pfennigii]|uniref:hypothetical protein n=1 Tax=Afifella pfennigii TaxID=209897 RepID=UPI00047A4A68|nr:hypothetical protein [Afifella pfennigii]